MANFRTFVVYGEFMVYVSGSFFNGIEELGLTIGPLRIIPKYYHLDVKTDDFGPDVPVEELWNMGELRLLMSLIHYDTEVLGRCYRSSMGGGSANLLFVIDDDGYMGQAGTPMGGGKQARVAGNNYITVHIAPAAAGVVNPPRYNPQRYFYCYLDSQPLEVPIGTTATVVQLGWRCIPYQPLRVVNGVPQEITSSGGTPLFDFSSQVIVP